MTSYTHKVVDGAKVTLTAQEIAALEAQEAEWAAQQPARDAERVRMDGLTTDEAALAMADRLANMTSAQIDNYFANNVTSPAQAIAVLKTICKILAVKLTPRFGDLG